MEIVRIKKIKNSLFITSLYEGLNINSNVFNNDVLYYTKKYIKENRDLIKKLLNDLNINKVIFTDEESFFAVYEIVN